MNIPINDLLKQMQPITLDEMMCIRLMDRVDSKFVSSIDLLPRILEAMIPNFKIQTIGNKSIAAYSTQYLDTSDLAFFRMHQNGKLKRQKIRIRSYIDSNLSFLEVKNKSNKGQTQKVRIPTGQSHIKDIDDLTDENDFLSQYSWYENACLKPVLDNTFNRITLVNNTKTERITIDWGLYFHNYQTGKEYDCEQLMVLELKQNERLQSDFHRILNHLRIKSSSFSKYCMGTVLTNENVKKNRFKMKWILINKITQKS